MANAQVRFQGEQAQEWAKHALWKQEVDTFMVDVREFMRKYAPIVDSMTDAAKISKAIKENTEAQRANLRSATTLRLSKTQAVVALVVGAAAVLDLVLRLHG